jgi:hypothetical protein
VAAENVVVAPWDTVSQAISNAAIGIPGGECLPVPEYKA